MFVCVCAYSKWRSLFAVLWQRATIDRQLALPQCAKVGNALAHPYACVYCASTNVCASVCVFVCLYVCVFVMSVSSPCLSVCHVMHASRQQVSNFKRQQDSRRACSPTSLPPPTCLPLPPSPFLPFCICVQRGADFVLLSVCSALLCVSSKG